MADQISRSNFKTHSVPFFLYLCEFACNVFCFHNFFVHPTFCGLIFVVILVMLVLEHCHCQLLLQYARHSILIGPTVGPCVQRNCKKAQYFGAIKTEAFFSRVESFLTAKIQLIVLNTLVII